jgi:hypothetical protein
MDVESRLRNLEERLIKLEGNKPVAPMMNTTLRHEEEMLEDPIGFQRRKMRGYGGRKTRRNKKAKSF